MGGNERNGAGGVVLWKEWGETAVVVVGSGKRKRKRVGFFIVKKSITCIGLNLGFCKTFFMTSSNSVIIII